MSIVNKIESISNHLTDAYNSLENIGVDLTNIDKNIENLSTQIESVYSDLPKVVDENTEITLSPTKKGKMELILKGNTSQDGTPTPDSPVDINVVSGSNVIKTSNKNLFIPSLKNDGTSIYVSNATVSLIKDEYTFIASGSDMYFGQVANTGATCSRNNGIKIYKNGNTKLSFLITNTTFNRVHITAYNSQRVSLGYTAFNGISGTYTFPENCEFVTIRIGKTNAVSGTTYKTKVMVVYGDTIPTTYEPHQGKELPLDLGNIELCKIETYQDHFYKSGSKWYLHKEVGKVVLDGTENWIRSGNTSESFFCGALSGGNIPFKAKIGTVSDSKTNYFVKGSKSSNAEVFDMYNVTDYYTTFVLYLSTSRATDITTFKNWLGTHNVILYYVLATPTDTEITDTTLINQLNALEQAMSYDDQTNISQENDNLPFIINATALMKNSD